LLRGSWNKDIRSTEIVAWFIEQVTVGNQINSYHFFDNTRQAYHIDSGRWIEEGRTFESLVNEWERGNHEQGKAAFFVNQSYYLFLERRT
jgi:hypothetical protein